MNIPADRTQTDRTGIENDDATFDRSMRQLHAAAVSQISPQTLARLRATRHTAQTAPKHGHAWRWVAATAFSAVLAVALGVQFLPHSGTVPATQPMVATVANDDGYDDSLAALDESPDLYMWLASSEAEPLAME
jgi:anti-sigma-K factor RskA